jgi:hypothetical protein
MENKKPWLSYDKISNLSDAFSYIKDIGFDLNDSFEHLNQGSPVRAKGIPTEKYTAGNTNDATESISSSESFLTQNPSNVARRYSPANKQDYSGYRPPDPVFLSYQDSKSNLLVTEGPTKYKSISDIDRKDQKGFSVKQLASKKEEYMISPEAKEFLQMLQKTNPEIKVPEAQDISESYNETQNVSQAYNISAKPIEIKTSVTVKEISPAESIIITKNQQSNAEKEDLKSIQIDKPVKTTRVSQYTQPIDFFSINNNKTEIIDEKSQNKILNKNTVNLSKISTDVNQFINNTKIEFRQNLLKNIVNELSIFEGDKIEEIKNQILNEINNVQDIKNIQESIESVIVNKLENKQDEKTIQVLNVYLNETLPQIIVKAEQDFLEQNNIFQDYKNEIISIVNNNQNNTNLASTLESIQQIKNSFSEVKTEQIFNAFNEFLSPLESVVKQTNESHNYSLYNDFLSNIQNIQNEEVNNLRNELVSKISQNSSIQIVNDSASKLAQHINQNNLSNNDVDYIQQVQNIYNQHENAIVNNANYFYSSVALSQLQNIDNNLILNNIKQDVVNNINSSFSDFKTSLNVKNIRSNIVNTISKNENVDNVISILNQDIDQLITNNDIKNFIQNIIKQEINNFNLKSLSITENRQVIQNFENTINESITNLTKDIIYKVSDIEIITENETITNLLNNIKTVNTAVQNTNNLDYSLQSLTMIDSSLNNAVNILGDEIINSTNKVIEEEYNSSVISQEQYEQINNIFSSNISKYDIINKIRHYLAQYNLESKFSNKNYISNLTAYESLNRFTDIKNYNIESFISKVYKTSIDLTNVSQSLISTREILKTFQNTIDKISILAPNNEVVSEIQERLNKTQNTDITNKFFNLITSSNVVEEGVKNFLISQNETISNYTLNIIKENVYKHAFDDYVFVSEIKNIIEKKESTNSFATLTEIKEVLNRYNLEEVKNAFVDIKNIITNVSNGNVLNNSVVENIDTYVNNLSNISSELVAKTLVENKNYSELKNISMLSQVKNSNLSQQFNNAISKITEQLGSTTNVQQILNTINTELNNLNINQNLSENTIVNQNSDFINQIYNSVKNNSQEENKNYVNNLKQQFLNETLSTAENIISNQNIKIENISNVLKTLNINNFNSSNVNQLKNIIQENVIANNYEINENNQLNYFSNYLNNLAFKVDLIENSTNINNFDEINILAKETALKYTTEFSEVKNEIKVLNTFRNEIQNVNNYNDLNEVINNFQTNIKQLKLEQIDFVANTLIDNSEYKRFIKENKELLTFTNLQETLTTNSVFLNNEVKQVLNNVLESNDSLQSVVNNFANITQQNISSVYQNSSNNTNFSDMNVFEKNNIITELNNIYSEEVIKQRFENYETKTFSSLLETVNLINLNNNLSVQQKIDNIVSSISFMSSAKESILEYLLKNFNVFNMERTYNSLTKNLIEEVELNIQNYDIQKNVSEALNNNIYINQNILNSQIIENASNVIKNTLKTEILNENFESIFNQQNNNELVNDLAKVLTSTSNYSLLNTVVLESVENEINQVISQKISNNNDQNYSQLSVLNYTNDSKNINLPDNISKINTTNTTQQTFENTTSSFEVINNEEDVDVSNLRIDKIWNNFVKTEVDKIVEEINSDGEINNVNNVDQRTFNNTSSNINSTSSNIVNNSYESNVNQDLSSTKNESNYYSLNDSSIVAPNTSKIIRETETTITEVERINILQITETVFEKIEQKLKSYNVTQEDIVILKQKIIFEVTEYYERRTSDEIRKTEKRVKDDIQDMFIKFLNT